METAIVTMHDVAIGCFVLAAFISILVIGEKLCLRRRDTYTPTKRYGRKTAR